MSHKLLGIVACLSLGGTAPLAAQNFVSFTVHCIDSGVAERDLAQRYQERIVAMGAMAGGALMQLFESPGGSWTMTIRTHGMTCIIGAGEHWVDVTPKEPET